VSPVQVRPPLLESPKSPVLSGLFCIPGKRQLSSKCSPVAISCVVSQLKSCRYSNPGTFLAVVLAHDLQIKHICPGIVQQHFFLRVLLVLARISTVQHWKRRFRPRAAHQRHNFFRHARLNAVPVSKVMASSLGSLSGGLSRVWLSRRFTL